MVVRCNICSKELEEKEVDTHVATKEHKEGKEKLARKNETGSEVSVVKVWMNSLRDG
ncbi:MAG TPA: hypothetical protein VJ792_00820 [Candidatus Nitrosotalea sp.]|nr:hypothetical protein [Candidatus Nitrosotalea sp.]